MNRHHYPEIINDDVLYYAEIIGDEVTLFKRNFLSFSELEISPLMMMTRHGMEVHPWNLFTIKLCPIEPTIDTIRFMVDAMNEKVLKDQFK